MHQSHAYNSTLIYFNYFGVILKYFRNVKTIYSKGLGIKLKLVKQFKLSETFKLLAMNFKKIMSQFVYIDGR